jgi:N-acetyl-alpha-D-glucosaminyl L-malate synthase BshA
MNRERLKIGITCYPSLGGSGVIATELGKLLAEQGHMVHFITSSMPFRLGKYHPNIFYHEVEVNHYSVFHYPPYDLTLASKMAQVANREGLDILHVHYAVPHAVCAYLAKQMIKHPIKIITTLHGTDITVLGSDATLKEMIIFGIENSDVVTAVSQHLIDQTYEILQVKKPINKVYNFVDKRVYYRRNACCLKEKHATDGEKLIVHISNFRPVKRVMDVAHIFKSIREKLNAKIFFIGEGPEFPKVNQWLKEQGLCKDVIYLGKQDDVAEILSQMDLMLLPSEKESFGLVALEAMSCGVPVVASDTGGIPEVIRDGVTGFTCGIGNVEQMAAAAIKILTDEKAYKSMSEACVAEARSRFCGDEIMHQYLDLYYQVLQN